MRPVNFSQRYGLTARTALDGAAPNAVVMHPGPMNRGVEIDPLIADDPERSLITLQVEMGVAVRMACLELLVGSAPLSAWRSAPARRQRRCGRNSCRPDDAATSTGAAASLTLPKPFTDRRYKVPCELAKRALIGVYPLSDRYLRASMFQAASTLLGLLYLRAGRRR